MPDHSTIYKISRLEDWERAASTGVFSGAQIDVKDGFIHFSTKDQVEETASKHFTNQSDLVLVAVDASALGDSLKWEVSRNNDLFPHLYDALKLSAVTWVRPMPLKSDGTHVIPIEKCC